MTTHVLLETLVFIFGGGTLGSLLLFFNANKKLKNAEADKATAEARFQNALADKGVIDNYEVLIERYEKYIISSDKKFEDYKKMTDKQIDSLLKEFVDIKQKYKEIEDRQKANQKFMCYKIDCQIRERGMK